MEYKLYHGASPYLSLEAVHSYIKSLEDKDISKIIINADTVKSQSVIDTISSPTLFSSRRIIFLKRTYKNKDKSNLTEKIMEILKEPNGNDILVFWEDQKVKSNTRYYKFFKTKNALEEIPELNKRTFFTWLRKELEKQDLKIDQSIIKEFAERTNYDPERCANEIAKFKLNNFNKIIEKEDLESLTADTLEKDIWDLVDAINTGDKVSSMLILEKLSAQFVDANYILSMLARNLRLIYLTKSLIAQNKDYREISSILRIPPFTTPTIVKSSSNYSTEKITMLYTKLSNLDYQIKRGQINGMLGLTLICPHL